MADNSELDLLHEMRSEGEAVSRLLAAQGAFESAYRAFRAEDAGAFQEVIRRAGLQIWCRRICRWIRTKECVFLCLELAGPPTAFDRPDPRVLARALGRLAADERLVKKLADVLVKRDRGGFLEIVKKLEIQPYAHFFCHWLCTIRYRLVCRWICTIGPQRPPILWAEIQAAGRALGELAEDERTFKAVAAASSAGDSVKFADVLRNPRWMWRCDWVCQFFCSWRCVLVCLSFARPFPFAAIEGPAQIREARAFGEAIAKLNDNPAAVQRLAAAVGSGQVDRWTAIVKELKYERFALQLCHWICGWRCRLFCRLVCPDPHYYPWFDAIGDFGIYSDIDPASGLTNAAKFGTSGTHGGPNFGFFADLSLHAFCPEFDPAHPAERMSYRFLFRRQGDAGPTPIAGGFVSPVRVGSRLALWNGGWHWQSVWVRGTGATSPTPPTPGIGLSPPDHFIVPDGQGWVEVDPETADSAFHGYLMGFASHVAVAGGAAPTGVAAGTAVPVADQKNGTDCEIVYQATRSSTIAAVNGGAAPDYSNSVAKVRINNWADVALLDLLQFHTGGGTPCSPLNANLDIEYSVDHELIAGWGLGLTTAAGMVLTAPPPPPSTPRGGAGTHHENIAAWPTCSYTVSLSTRRRLTNGISDDSGRTVSKTFCIGTRRP
jgi:hypothetical protein